MTKIKCVTFDLDDTLWAVHPPMKVANRNLWDWLTRETPAFVERYELKDLFEGSALRQSLLERFPEIAHSMTEIRLRLLEEGFSNVGYDREKAQELAAAAFDSFMVDRHAVTPYENVVELLQSLKDHGYLIGALSNGNADVKRTAIGPWFDFQFNADGVGTAKPHPLMFEKALQHAGVKPNEVVHIGDHPINDVQGAKSLGIHTIWVNPEGLEWEMPIDADRRANCLSEIPALVESFNQ